MMWTCFITLILFEGGGAFQTDIFFKSYGDLRISSTSFYVLVQIDISEFYHNLKELRAESIHLSSSMQTVVDKKRDIIKMDMQLYLREEKAVIQLLAKFKTELEEMQIFMESFLATLPSTQSSPSVHHNRKRSAGPFQPAVNFISHLFGIASTDDIKKISVALHAIHQNQENIAEGLNTQVEVLNATLTDITSLHLQFDTIKKHIKRLSDSVTNFATRKATEEKITLGIIYGQLINSQLQFLNQRISTFVNALASAKEGRLSPTLLDAKTLLRILRGLPSRVAKILPKKPEHHNLPFFYEIIKTRLVRGSFDSNLKKLTVLINIPLLSYETEFKLYELETLPFPVEGTDFYSKLILKHKFFGVADDLNKFINLKDLDKCVRYYNEFLCDIPDAIYTAASHTCLVNHFLNLDTHELCPRLLVKHFDPTFIKVQDGYVYSVYGEFDLWRTCNASRDKIVLSGVGIIPLSPDCMLVNPTLILPPLPSFPQTEFQTKFEFGQVKSYVNNSKVFDLVHDIDFKQALHELDDNIAEGIPISKLQQRLHVVKVRRLESSQTLSIFFDYSKYFLPLVFTFVMMIVIYFCCKCSCGHKIFPCIFKPKVEKQNSAGFQVNIHTSPETRVSRMQRSFRRISRALQARPLPHRPDSQLHYETVLPATGPQVKFADLKHRAQYIDMSNPLCCSSSTDETQATSSDTVNNAENTISDVNTL